MGPEITKNIRRPKITSDIMQWKYMLHCEAKKSMF